MHFVPSERGTGLWRLGTSPHYARYDYAHNHASLLVSDRVFWSGGRGESHGWESRDHANWEAGKEDEENEDGVENVESHCEECLCLRIYREVVVGGYGDIYACYTLGINASSGSRKQH